MYPVFPCGLVKGSTFNLSTAEDEGMSILIIIIARLVSQAFDLLPTDFLLSIIFVYSACFIKNLFVK
ncbi:hypothetical protein GDO86_009334 [Hymenochirus boettgeri]|uniref:Uncharacterized protein n=1 Tax=Hymenochirus boettgeri TaxID=247094 RepID=A0A8T2JKT3_9PIPI|nr:hypothetical protein GDO86_009334 [Hymenochirus boettgeri]